jgi:hypothetical protein
MEDYLKWESSPLPEVFNKESIERNIIFFTEKQYSIYKLIKT